MNTTGRFNKMHQSVDRKCKEHILLFLTIQTYHPLAVLHDTYPMDLLQARECRLEFYEEMVIYSYFFMKLIKLGCAISNTT